MADISRIALFGKLNSLCYRAVESSTVFCKLRGNPYVELVHWLHQILQLPDSDLHCLIRHYDLDQAALARDIVAALDRLPRGSGSVSDLSWQVEEAVQQGWLFCSLMFGETAVRSGHLMMAIAKTSGLRNALHAISPQFASIRTDEPDATFAGIFVNSPEASAMVTVAPEAGQSPAPAAMGRGEALKRYTQDLTEQARNGKLDPIVGRDAEIRQVIDILMRRRQNNPILTGEAGVGKTAVAEGFAQRIVAGDVPPALREVSLCMLDVGLLQAGAGVKGEFENRLRQVIEEVQASPKPVILFIDEAHTLVGAGGAAGTGDAANLLKPALARGTLRTLAATTWDEYKKHIEKDPALTRRFQVVQVAEPSEVDAVLMMRGIVSAMERHHQVQVLDEALEAAVSLSHRYIPVRQLPDKSVSLLDTACARVAVSQHATPPAVGDCRQRIAALETELDIIVRETAIGIDTAARGANVEQKLAQAHAQHRELEARWETEKQLVESILELRASLRQATGLADTASSEGEGAGQLAALRKAQDELATLQGEAPLILPSVDRQAIAVIVQEWTGIPVGRMAGNDISNILTLAHTLGQRIIGQQHAMGMIARRIHTARAGLDNPDKPVGVFLLAGTSGVGKTETALALAEALYGGEQNIITINMSEYQEAHTVSTLKGAPPGYIGYGEGGVLTEAVRRRPYSVVLLDEVEKAHPDVHEIFFQVFDKGWMEDGEGRVIDFRNTLILLTTNAGSDTITDLCRDPQQLPEPAAFTSALRESLLQVFPPALLGRMVTIPYYPLSDHMLGAIIRLQLRRIDDRIGKGHNIPFSFTDDVVHLIAARCTELESGGRMIDAILTNSILPAISGELLVRMRDQRAAARVHVGVADGEFTYAFD